MLKVFSFHILYIFKIKRIYSIHKYTISLNHFLICLLSVIMLTQQNDNNKNKK